MNYINEKEVGEINLERIGRKWAPVMEALNVEKDKEFYSLYAEVFQRLYDSDEYLEEKEEKEEKLPISAEEYEIRMKVDPFGEENWGGTSKPRYERIGIGIQNLLPVGLKILSKLNISDKNVVLTNDLDRTETITSSIRISSDRIENMGFIGMDYVTYIEGIAMEMIIKTINEKLETSNTFYINHMVSSISIISEGTFNPTIVYKSMVGFA